MLALGFLKPLRRIGPPLAGLMISVCLAAAQGPVRVALKASTTQPVAVSAGSRAIGPADGPIRGPMLGYVFDPSSLTLRPVLGIPGASYVGNALPLGFTPQLLEVSPSHDYALAVEAGSGKVFVVDLRAPLPAAQQLAQAAPGADRIFISPLGKAAAFYDRESKQVEILAGLPDEPQRKGRVDLVSLPGVMTALAVSDDGQTLLAAVSQGDTGSLFVAGPDEQARLLGPAGRVTAISFLNDSQDALVADLGRNEVVRIRNVKTGAEWTVLASRQDGLLDPVAVAASRDNAMALVASSAERRIALLPLAGGPAEFMDCPCHPTGVHALTAGSVFRLTDASSAPMYVLEVRPQGNGLATQPRILFVPAPSRSSTGDDAVHSPRGRVRQ